MKRILIAVLTLTFISICPGEIFAATEDDEISIMAAEQRRFNEADVTVNEEEDIETFDNNQDMVNQDENDPNNPNDKIDDENKQNINDSITNPIDDSIDIMTPDVDVTNVDNLQDSAGMPSPIVTYSSFNEAAKKVGFIPLYIPRKSGFVMNYIAVIRNEIIEIRYGRRWEPNVTLSLRTYKRSPGEELKDISGVYGVKWKVDLSSGTTIYIARISDTTNAAAWSVGQYTFAAMTENLSFAAFHALIIEEIVDLCNHYFIDIS